MIDDAVLDAIRLHHDELTAIRQDIHAHPELGLEETRTAGLVAARLRAWGVEVTEGVGGTGVVGTVRGSKPGNRAIGLRADMDALAIHEQTGKAYASTNPGKMHACGHDGHTTMLLGAAQYLAEHRDFGGTVHLIFQPAEEGRGGAVAMMKDGLFDRFPCDAIFGLHNGAGRPEGTFLTCTGPTMAGAGLFRVQFQGTGGHGGSTPHLATDITVAQAQFVLALQTIVSRNVSPRDTAVVSVGHVAGGDMESLNVMPATAFVGGTIRCFDMAVGDILTTRINELAQAMAQANRCTVEVSTEWLTIPLVNPPEQVEAALAAAGRVVAPPDIDPAMPPTTGGEDFAAMMAARPGAFVFLGNGHNPDGSFHAVHTPKYDFNDAIIPLGSAYWVALVKTQLGTTG